MSDSRFDPNDTTIGIESVDGERAITGRTRDMEKFVDGIIEHGENWASAIMAGRSAGSRSAGPSQ